MANDSKLESTERKASGPPARAARTRVRKYLRWVMLSLTAFLVIVVSNVAGIYLRNPTIRQIVWNMMTHPNQMRDDKGHFDPTGYYLPSSTFPPEKQKSLTVLLMGLDHDYSDFKPNTIIKSNGRSDSIMLARFDFEDNTIDVLSIPRDTRVRIPEHGIHKINAAHQYGGPELSRATISQVFGITPDYYVDLNFEGFQQVVDAIGGVDVTVHQPLNYDDNWGNLHVHLKPGPQHLNGYKAMGYVRIRHTDNDLMRAQRQHEFLEALRSRVASPSSVVKLPGVLSAVTDNIKSDLTTDQMVTLANVARKIPHDNIRVETLPVIQGKTFVYIDRRKSASMIQRLFFPKDSQVATTLEIKTPDAEELPRRRKRHHRLRETGASLLPEGTRHRSHGASPAPAGEQKSDSTTSPSGGDHSSTGTSGLESGKGSSDGPSRAPRSASQDHTGGGETPRPESGGSSDSGKSPDKGREGGSGTSSGATTPLIRA